jgi:hypothetical protein
VKWVYFRHKKSCNKRTNKLQPSHNCCTRERARAGRGEHSGVQQRVAPSIELCSSTMRIVAIDCHVLLVPAVREDATDSAQDNLVVFITCANDDGEGVLLSCKLVCVSSSHVSGSVAAMEASCVHGHGQPMEFLRQHVSVRVAAYQSPLHLCMGQSS